LRLTNRIADPVEEIPLGGVDLVDLPNEVVGNQDRR
jgi:hypothetical protein